MDNELINKEVAFNKVIKWLKDNNFGVTGEIRNKDLKADIQFYALIIPQVKIQNNENMQITMVFGQRFADNFTLGVSMQLEESLAKSLDALKDEVKKQQFLIDLKKMSLAQNCHCDIKFPAIEIHRNIFIDSLNTKQFFFDCIFSIIHLVELVQMRIAEFHFSIFPDRNKGEKIS